MQQAPSLVNRYLTYVATADGGVQALHYFGLHTDPRTAVVESVRIVSSTTVVTRARATDPKWGKQTGDVFDTVLELKNNHKYTLVMTQNDGVTVIRDARYIGNGKPTVVREKCLVRPVS